MTLIEARRIVEKRLTGPALRRARLNARKASITRARRSRGGFMDPAVFAANRKGKVKIGSNFYKAGKEAIGAAKAMLDAADSPRRKAKLRKILAAQRRLTPSIVRARTRGKRPLRKSDD